MNNSYKYKHKHWGTHAIMLLLIIGYTLQQVFPFEQIGLLANQNPFSQWVRLLTYPFFHGNWPHLVLNLMLIEHFARKVHNDIAFHQSGIFRINLLLLAIFFVCVLVGGIAYSYLGISKLPLVGASAGTYGLISYHCFGLFPGNRYYLFGTVPMRRWHAPFVLLFIELLAYQYTNVVVGLSAHLGGILAGMFCAFLVKELSINQVKNRFNNHE